MGVINMKNKKDKKLTKKEITEKTVKRMKETRKADFIFLRNIIESKLKFAEETKVKTEEAILKARQSIEQNTITHQKVTGMIMVLNELLEEKTELEKELDKKGKKIMETSHLTLWDKITGYK